jgi:hypothetical protein
VPHRPACPVVRPTAGRALERRRGDLAGGSRGSFELKQPRTGNLARERLAIADREERVPATGCRGENSSMQAKSRHDVVGVDVRNHVV